MPKPESCVLVHFVSEQAVGFQFPRHRNDWPLHVTLASWFETNDMDILAEKLEAQAGRTSAFKLRVGEFAMFGPRQNVPVNVISNQKPVRELHEKLVGVVRELGGTFDSKRWFDNYRAHITQHDGAASSEGEMLAVDDFHLVRLLPENICEVAQQFMLKGHDEAAA